MDSCTEGQTHRGYKMTNCANTTHGYVAVIGSGPCPDSQTEAHVNIAQYHLYDAIRLSSSAA